ncbi:MAG TPA: glycosyltransferase family A protein [Pirellulales bacterium]|nr:glycosyltransferase family A protein [Pirellulales bacterium]
MAHEPLVSAVIPSYNGGPFVAEAVASACAQTYPRMEIVFVDDGSTDDTYERLRPYLGRIRYLRQENRGLSAARNAGIAAAQGQWIALLDSDDVWHAEKTSVQLKAAREHNALLVGSRPTSLSPAPLPLQPAARVLGLSDFVVSAPIGPSGTIIHRGCFEKVGLFDETLRSIEDRDMWLRIASEFVCLQVQSPCWWYRVHQGQMSRRAGRMFDNYRRVLDKFFATSPRHHALRAMAYSYLYADAAWAYFAEGDRRRAISYLLKSVCRYPGRLKGAGRPSSWSRSKELARYVFGRLPALQSLPEAHLVHLQGTE